MAGYSDIEKVNSESKTTDIKGKDYIQVNDRIKAFRKIYPEGTIETELLSNAGGVCIFKATASTHQNGEKKILGTGHAYEKEGSSFINKTSYIENCETSAVGRALGMCGIGIDTSLASYEEVANASLQQNEQKARTGTGRKETTVTRPETVRSTMPTEPTEINKVSEVMVKSLCSELTRTGVGMNGILKAYGVAKLYDMTVEQHKNAMEKLKKKPNKLPFDEKEPSL